MGFIGFLIVGALAGFLAGKFMKGDGFGLWGNLGVGIVGGFLGGWLFGMLGIGGGGMIWSTVVAFVGAVILLWVVDKVKG